MNWFGKDKREEKALASQRRFRWRFENLRNLLRLNGELMELLSDIQSYAGGKIPEDCYSYHQMSQLVDGVALMIENLNYLADNRFTALYAVHRDLAGRIQQALVQTRTNQPPSLVMSLHTVDRNHMSQVGGKAAHLGELSRILPDNIPHGFVVTTAAYYQLLNENNLTGELRSLFSRINAVDISAADRLCNRIKQYVANALVPEAVTEEIEHAVNSSCGDRTCQWAVRSSAVGEDGALSFAGQFDSLLNVPPQRLIGAYLRVVASRFNPHAIMYRLAKGIREAECPMAVLFIPMVAAEAAGVIFTRHPHADQAGQLLISSVKGLAADLVSGASSADSFFLDRSTLNLVKQAICRKEHRLTVSGTDGLHPQPIPQSEQMEPSLSPAQVRQLGRLALMIEDHYGMSKDIEWAMDANGTPWILQARPLQAGEAGRLDLEPLELGTVVAEGEATIFPGRAQGRLHCLETLDRLSDVPYGAVLLVRQAVPEIVSVFPRLTGLIAEQGHPTGHAATLAREFSLPTVYGVVDAFERLSGVDTIGLDALRRKIYLGLPWPDLPQRDLSAEAQTRRPTGPIDDLVFRLELGDPAAANFTPQGCHSIHDLIRFTHEKAVTTLFDIGDSQVEYAGSSLKVLKSKVPLSMTVLDVGTVVDERLVQGKTVPPEGIRSIPFQALWRGISDPAISWAGRTNISLSGLGSVVMTSMSGDVDSSRYLGDRNYMIVGADYLNLNARLAYHFALVDALVSGRPFNNYVSFRFRGGGAARANRSLRARFLAGVLVYAGFSVDRREDLVTAWFRGYERTLCETRLETLGRLMGCARQLDMLLDSDAAVTYFVGQFQTGNYDAFH